MRGETGGAGVLGSKGEKGDPGLTGSQGPLGIKGAEGPPGPKVNILHCTIHTYIVDQRVITSRGTKLYCFLTNTVEPFADLLCRSSLLDVQCTCVMRI